MNAITRNTAIIAIAAAAISVFGAITPAFAGEATYELPQPAVSTTNRADVQAQLTQARHDGTLLATEADFQRLPAFVATKARADVAADARIDVAASHALLGEPHDFDVRATRPARASLVAQLAR